MVCHTCILARTMLAGLEDQGTHRAETGSVSQLKLLSLHKSVATTVSRFVPHWVDFLLEFPRPSPEVLSPATSPELLSGIFIRAEKDHDSHRRDRI